MKIHGTFTTPATSEQLRATFTAPDGLQRVSTLRDVTRDSAEVLRMVYTPRLTLGQVPLDTTVTTLRDAGAELDLRVVGQRGTQSIQVTLSVVLQPGAAGTVVGWSGDLVVRGGVASTGQRVVGDLATQAIDTLLAECAAVAADGSSVA